MKAIVFRVRLAEEFLQEDQAALNKFLENVSIRRTSPELIQSDPNYWSVFLCYEETADVLKKKAFIKPKVTGLPIPVSKEQNSETEIKETEIEELPLTELESVRLETLKQWRNETALRLNLPGYMVTSNATLANVARINPQIVEALIHIKGLGPNKVERFGEDIIALLNTL